MDADNNVNTPDVPRQNTYTWTYDANGKLLTEVLDSFDNAADRTDTFMMDLFGNRRKRTTDKPSTAFVDEVITYLYNADDRITSELLDKQNNGTTDQTTTYAWSGTRQSSKTVVIPSTSTVTQTFSYTLPGMLSRVVTENRNGSNVVTSRTRVDYDYTSTGIRSLSVDWNDANLNNSFATSERTGSVEYLVDSTNHTGYAQTIVETTKNAAGVATKRIVYTYGSDEISQTTYLPPSGGSAGWNAGTTLTFSHDAHTSVRMLTDAAGAIAQVFTYAAYGELIAIHNRIAQSVGTMGAQGLQSQALTSLLYNGEAFDSRIGQLYLRARWYDGHRFTTLDPYFGNGSDPLSFNKYGFVHANPVMGIDPTGLMTMSNMMVGVAGFAKLAAGGLPAVMASKTFAVGVGAFGVAYLLAGPLRELWRTAGPGVAGTLTAAGVVGSAELIAAASTMTVADALGSGLLADIVTVTAQELAESAGEWAGSNSEKVRAIASHVADRAKGLAKRIADELTRQGKKLSERVFFNVEDFWPQVYSVDSARIAANPSLMLLTYERKSAAAKAKLLDEIARAEGLPTNPPSLGQERHEFPYASTSEAAVGVSSARWIDGVENLAHGTVLNGFYRRGRFVGGERFLVLLVPQNFPKD